jgi:hypothetical protein
MITHKPKHLRKALAGTIARIRTRHDDPKSVALIFLELRPAHRHQRAQVLRCADTGREPRLGLISSVHDTGQKAGGGIDRRTKRPGAAVRDLHQQQPVTARPGDAARG